MDRNPVLILQSEIFIGNRLFAAFNKAMEAKADSIIARITSLTGGTHKKYYAFAYQGVNYSGSIKSGALLPVFDTTPKHILKDVHHMRMCRSLYLAQLRKVHNYITVLERTLRMNFTSYTSILEFMPVPAFIQCAGVIINSAVSDYSSKTLSPWLQEVNPSIEDFEPFIECRERYRSLEEELEKQILISSLDPNGIIYEGRFVSLLNP